MLSSVIMVSKLVNVFLLLALLTPVYAAQQANFGLPGYASVNISTKHADVASDLIPEVSARRLSSIISKEDFTVLSHPEFPGHGVRVKKTDFCDPTVKYGSSLDMSILN
jgi:hypothetical protein